MSVRFQIAAMVFMMVQAVLFGAGMVLVLATPLSVHGFWLVPAVIVSSMVISGPLSWWIAPRLRMTYWRSKGTDGDFISGPAHN